MEWLDSLPCAVCCIPLLEKENAFLVADLTYHSWTGPAQLSKC